MATKLETLFRKKTPRLDARSKDLTVVPSTIGAATHLERIDLTGNLLTSLPPEIGALTGLTELKLDRNPLTALPETLGRLAKLESLSATDTSLATLPTSIGDCSNLRQLWLSGSKLSSLPASMAKLTSLEILSIAQTELTELPSWLGELASLVTIHAGGKTLERVTDAIGKLGKLKGLSVEETSVTELPDVFGGLRSLTDLSVMGGRLGRIPRSLANAPALESVRLYDQPELDWESTLETLAGVASTLRTLLLRGGSGKRLSPTIGRLTTLTTLCALDAGLTDVPAEITSCEQVSSIDLSGNPLPAVPAALADMKSLTSLTLSRCMNVDWERVPLSRLQSLRTLTLIGCGLDALPAHIEEVSTLERLYVDGNELPESAIARLRKALPKCSVVRGAHAHQPVGRKPKKKTAQPV